MGKYLPEVFLQTERRRSEVCAHKTNGKHFPMQTEQTKLTRNLSCDFWLVLSSLLIFFVFGSAV